MKNAIRLVPAIWILLASGCSEREPVIGAGIPAKSYPIRDLSGEIPAFWTLETLRSEEAKAFGELLERATSKEQEKALREALGTDRVSVVSTEDSIATDLISRIYAIRDVIRDRERPVINPQFIVDPEDQ